MKTTCNYSIRCAYRFSKKRKKNSLENCSNDDSENN